ncbi:TonB family protein [Bradyrhizobium sp. LVM 105]|nr:TonB family protein [Bradyrhizobium sp. LVM 105]
MEQVGCRQAGDATRPCELPTAKQTRHAQRFLKSTRPRLIIAAMQMKFSLLAALLGLLATLPAYAQTVASDTQESSINAWKRQVSNRLVSKSIYPRNSPTEGGTAKVLFVLDRTGNLISSALAESTGSGELDAAALAMVEAAAPFPEPPAEIDEDGLRLTAPIVFRAKTTLPWTGSLPPAESAAEQAKVDAKMRSICRRC